ncbi:MAG: C25 family cysteine peptidase [Acidobacteriota bacterium]
MTHVRIDNLKTLAVAQLAAAAMVAYPLLADEDVRLLSETESGLTIELATPRVESDTLYDAGGSPYQKVRVEGWASVATPGHPDLPVRSVLIRVPPDSEAVLHVVEQGHESYPDQEVGSVPRLRLGEKGAVLTEHVRDASVYGQPDFYPGKTADVSDVQWLRGVPVRRVTMYPIQWNPSTRELRVSQRMLVEVSFGPGPHQPAAAPTPSADGAFEQLLDDAVINYDAADLSAPAPGLEPGSETDESRPLADALKIGVKQAGIYRVGYGDLRNAGVIARRINPSSFRLTNKGNEVAFKLVSRSSSKFRNGDYLEFYAERLDDQFTDTNVYWLQWGGNSGTRMDTVDGSVTGLGTPLGSFWDTLHVEENHRVWEGTPGATEEDYWFWERITSQATKNYGLQVPGPAAEAYGAIVRVCYRGYSTGVHHTQVSLNGTLLSDEYWAGTIAHTQEMTATSALLLGGANTLTVQLIKDPGASTDQVLLNWIEVVYKRRFEAVGDQLAFTVEGAGRYLLEVANLSPDATVFDISDPRDVKEVTGLQIGAAGRASKVSFETDLAGQKRYWAAAQASRRVPDEVTFWRATNLKSRRNSADYIVISPRGFKSAADRLCELRKKQGLRTVSVVVDDIYNEFNYGIFNPQAIKDFLANAYRRWRKPAPTHVVLLGDANTDYRDYFLTGAKNLVPVHLSITSELGITPDDNWYVAVDGNDSLPDMFIGRLSAKDASSADSLVRKVSGYQAAADSMPKTALFAADNYESVFEQINETLIGLLPSRYEPRRVYLGSYSSTAQATQDIIANIDSGVVITNYVGHANVTIWTGEGLFDSADVASLQNNDHLTFVMTLDCLNGYFSNPYYDSLGEEFVVAHSKGAVASFAPTGLGYSWEHSFLGEEVFSSIFEQGRKGLGQITTQSRIKAYARGATEDLVKTFTLLGDTATELAVKRRD